MNDEVILVCFAKNGGRWRSVSKCKGKCIRVCQACSSLLVNNKKKRRLQLSATGCTCNQLKPVATGQGNCSLQSSSVSVAVALNFEKIGTGPGPVSPKKGKKDRTGPDFKTLVVTVSK